MSKERELLERWIDGRLLNDSVYVPLLKETQKLLAQPEQEPVAWGIYDPDSDMLISIYGYKEKPDKVLKDRFKWVKLYAFPLTREPLSEEKIIEASKYYIEGSFQFIFKKGVRWAEKAHEIGGEE